MEYHGAAGPGSGAESLPAVEPGYRIDRLLGSGRAGWVWLAVREHDGARFALKTAATADGPAGTFETRRELNIFSRFEHENLLQLHTMLETSRGPGLLSDYAAAGSLVRITAARGTLTPGEAVTVLVGIGSALAYLHSQGVSHEQVTSGNILFTPQGKPLLGDLGTARLFGSGSATDIDMPDAEQSVPGALPGQSLAGSAGDVHALAGIGWLALTGNAVPPPRHRPQLSAMMPAVPPLLAEAIEAGLSEDPQSRPDAADFVRLVFASAVAEPLDLAMPIPGTGPEPQSRRARTQRGRALRGLHSGRRRSSSGRTGQGVRGGKPRLSRLMLSVAAVLVAATMGVGAVAVAAPELLQRQSGTEASRPYGSPGEGRAAVTQEPEPTQKPEPTQEVPLQDAEPGDHPDRGTTPTGSPEHSRTPDAGAEPAGGQGPLTVTPEPELQALLHGEDPVAAAGALAELRARAFSAADAQLLDGINVPGSSAMLADRAQIAKLEAAGTFLSGLSVEILSAGPVLSEESGRVSVPAAVSTSAYAERDAEGNMMRDAVALSRQDVVLVMVRTPEGWRIEEIMAPPT